MSQKEAYSRIVIARGKWGIANATPLTDKDTPIIEQLATDMEAIVKERTGMMKIEQEGKDPDATHLELMGYLG